ncbi:MAG: glycosyltransferase family 39 protein [Pseudomonadota bacterium]
MSNEMRNPATAWLIRLRLPLIFILWALAVWLLAMPDNLVVDWRGWRQADTQTIAVNALRPEAQFSEPLINWSRATQPRPVEAEFQLYTALISIFLRLDAEAVWPGQLISLLSLSLAGWALFVWLRGRYGQTAALGGVLCFLAGRAVLFSASTVAPDSLALACLVGGWIGFDRWLRSNALADWLIWVTLLTLAALMKVVNLQIGIATFLLVAMTDAKRLYSPMLWLGWIVMLGYNLSQLQHGANIFAETGLTFGIASGGDSKFPTLQSLLKPGFYLALMRMSLAWGVSVLGVGALILLFWRRAITAELFALGVAHAVGLLVALRYTVNVYYGTNYHAPGSLIGAIAVAVLLAHFACAKPAPPALQSRWQRWLPTLVLAAVALTAADAWRARLTLNTRLDNGDAAKLLVLGQTAAMRIPPGSAIAVRSAARRLADDWNGGVNNYEDPRLFWVLKSTGWAIALDDTEAADLAAAHAGGAQWFIDAYPPAGENAMTAWLAAHAQEKIRTPEGLLYRLR